MELKNNRLSFIDVAKGFGIILVVLGHCLAYECHNKLFFMIYAFHMPLFFFLSVFLYKSKDSATYLSGKIKTLLVPMIIFQSVNVVTYCILFLAGHEGEHDLIAFGGFWFLGTLLYVTSIYHILSEKFFFLFKHSKIIILFSALLTMTVGLIYAKSICNQPNQLIATSFVAFSFYALGHVSSTLPKVQDFISNNSLKKRTYATIIGFALFILLAYLVGFTKWNVDMNTSRYGSSFFFVLNALVGISATFFISIGIFKSCILEFFGKNSLMIFLIHIPLWRFFYFIFQNNLISQGKLCRSLCVFAICMLLSSFFAMLISKHLPWLTGKIKLN